MTPIAAGAAVKKTQMAGWSPADKLAASSKSRRDRRALVADETMEARRIIKESCVRVYSYLFTYTIHVSTVIIWIAVVNRPSMSECERWMPS